MSCKYYLKLSNGSIHEFANEIQLDDYLISKHKYESEYGDLVFSLSAEAISAREKAKQIAEDTKNLKRKAKETLYIDGIEVEHYDKPYKGVTQYLNDFRDSENNPLFPIFTPENYWQRRKTYWGDTHQDINEEYTSDKGKGVYTKEEKELIFGDQPPTRLSPAEMETWQKIIEQKWLQQGRLGEDIHHILEMFFRSYEGQPNFLRYKNNKQGLVDLIKKHSNDLKVNDDIIAKAIDYGYYIIDKIREIIPEEYRENLAFYPELKIKGETAEGTPQQLVGSIDLLVIDNAGNSYIFDFKTSPKQYDDYDSAKIRTFMYQLAVYNRLLQRYGFNDSNNKQIILPIEFVNYHLENKEEALLDPSKARFTYDTITWEEGAGVIRNLTPSIQNDSSLNAHLDSFLPAIRLKDVDTDTLVERVTEDMDKLFGGKVERKSYDDQYVSELIKDVKKNEDGDFIYKFKGGYYSNPIKAKSREVLHSKVKKTLEDIESHNFRRAKQVAEAVKYGKKNNLSTMQEILSKMGTKRLYDETGNMDFLEQRLEPYLQENWEVIEDDAALFFGCIIFKNKFTGQLDVIKISGKNLEKSMSKNPRRKNLSFAWETDINEQQLGKNSGMLLGTVGNVEAIEVLLLLNHKVSLLEDNKYKIGNIQIINPTTGQGSKAPNWQLEYSYKKLRTFSQMPAGIDHISNGDYKFTSLLDIAENDLKEELEKKDLKENPLHGRQGFLKAYSILDTAEDNQTKLEAVMNLLNLIKEKYPIEITQLNTNSSSRPARLYNKLLLAAAELRGIQFKQQLERTDKWPGLSIKKVLKNGLSSSYIDNPGNLDSETLNLLTQLVTEGYQKVRNELTEYIPKVRELTNNLKKSKNFGWLQENTIGNQTSLYKNMFRDVDDDLILKKVDDPSLNSAEREFLKYFLRVINHNRFPGKSDLELEQMEQNDDIEYYQVPLAKGEISSEIAMNGLFNTLKSKLENWTPRKALKELRAEAEGLFTEEEVQNIDHSNSKLFEMNNRFSRGDTDSKYRSKSITDNGKDFFEHNLETLLLEHTFAYVTQKHMNEVFPMIRAAMTHLKVMGEEEINKEFTPDLKYAEDYIKAVIKNQPIDKNLQEMETRALTSKLRQAASFVALGFSPVQGLYQTIQGLWVDLSLRIRKPDGTHAFTFSNFAKAFKIVYADLFPWTEQPSKVALLNELYAVNDMDMNTYMKNIRSDRTGIYNAYDLAFKFSSRPDYYNRMTILVAQMIEDGTWDAYEVENGKLVYKFEKDKRFEHLNNPAHPKYNDERALYYAIAQQHVNEGAKNPDGSDFTFSYDDKFKPLPQAHTIQEIESFKALGDLIYGYYSHEKKSLIHYTFYGALFMQMRTYWSGKKNQYLAPGGVRVQGKWAHAKSAEGKPLYYQVIDGKIRTDLPPTDVENTGAPVVQWEGLWQEGIMVTLSTIAQGAHDYINETGSYDIFEAIKNSVQEKYKNSEDLNRMYLSNIRQLGYDITLYIIVGCVAAGFLVNWEKELAKEAKKNGDAASGFQTSMVNVLAMSVRNSAADFAFWESIGKPALQWTPFSLETGSRIFSNIYSVMFGDKTIWGGITNTFAVTKQFKPLLQNVAPLYAPEE